MANVEGEADLADWVRFCLNMVRPKGSVTFIHRADRLECAAGGIARAGRRDRGLSALAGRQPAGEPGDRAGAQGCGDADQAVMPGMVLHEPDGRYSAAAEAVLRDGAALAL